MIDLVIATGLVALAIFGFTRRPDATMGSLLAMLLFSIPITHNLPSKGWVLSAMGMLEFALCCCMAGCWLTWVSQRARTVLFLSIVKFMLVCGLAFGPMTDADWERTMIMINALLVAQMIVAGGMADAVVWMLDRLDPTSARDRDLRSHRLGT